MIPFRYTQIFFFIPAIDSTSLLLKQLSQGPSFLVPIVLWLMIGTAGWLQVHDEGCLHHWLDGGKNQTEDENRNYRHRWLSPSWCVVVVTVRFNGNCVDIISSTGLREWFSGSITEPVGCLFEMVLRFWSTSLQILDHEECAGPLSVRMSRADIANVWPKRLGIANDAGNHPVGYTVFFFLVFFHLATLTTKEAGWVCDAFLMSMSTPAGALGLDRATNSAPHYVIVLPVHPARIIHFKGTLTPSFRKKSLSTYFFCLPSWGSSTFCFNFWSLPSLQVKSPFT